MMRGMKKKQIAELGQEWADLERQRLDKEAAKKLELQPLTAKYDRACAPVNERFKNELSPILTRQNELLDTIRKNLLAGVGPDGSVKIPLVEGDHFKLEVLGTTTRTLDPEKFINATPAAKRDGIFWGCVNVLIGKAEKFMGKNEVDALAEKETTHRVAVTYK